MNNFVKDFSEFTGIKWRPSDTVIAECEKLKTFAIENNYSMPGDISDVVSEAINQKLDIGKDIYKHILEVAFKEHEQLNYNLKTGIQKCVNSCDTDGYLELLNSYGIQSAKLKEAFVSITRDESIAALKKAATEDTNKEEILTAIFVRAFYNSFSKECCDLFFSEETIWDSDYIALLNRRYPGFSTRNISLAFVEVDKKKFINGYEDGCDYYFGLIRHYYQVLDNHSDMIITIPPIHCGEDIQWRLYSDIILYAEKHAYHTIDRTYFRYKKIEEITSKYIPNIDKKAAHFELAAEGFVFKDCFVITLPDTQGYQLAIILEKNVRDEWPINCPACRSKNVQGNSYPILNVRSWECENVLCPDRSKYNRGKRFSYVSYRRQRAMEDERNTISQQQLAMWHLDKVDLTSYDEIFDMACKFYSFAGDTIEVKSSTLKLGRTFKDRKIHPAPEPTHYAGLYNDFKSSYYFKRYDYDNDNDIVEEDLDLSQKENKLTELNLLYQGDSRIVLKALPEGAITGAVTSPPYYNAKSYSQWDNIYCYLYDMRNIAKEVYRVLAPGGVFLYNIFDYFDNERNIVFSAMGNKRMILGAYIIDLFRKIGFELQGNIIWFKGEIQGNRNFNQGNNTPYYQAPLNCWEHILVFSKGQPLEKFAPLKSQIRKIRPFIKYVKGKNVLGHDAPFPEDIPNILLNCMEKSDVILDPFSGSYTTGLAAYRKGIRSISIEMQPEYVELSRKRIKDVIEQNKYQQITLPFVNS